MIIKICSQKGKNQQKSQQFLSQQDVTNQGQVHLQQQIKSENDFESLRMDQLSYQKMFSSNDLDSQFDFFGENRINSFTGVSPGLSHTSYDLDSNDRPLEIQPYGSVSYNAREIPNIILAIRRRPAIIQASPPPLYQNQESCRTLSNISSPNFSPIIQAKKLQIKSMLNVSPEQKEHDEDEYFSVFDDEPFHYGNIPWSKVDFLTHLQQFLTLYKMRTGTYPRQREHLENEVVIKMAMNLAKIEKKLFKKYFPTKSVFFEDDTDYTRKKIQRKKNKQLTQVITPITPDFQFIREEL